MEMTDVEIARHILEHLEIKDDKLPKFMMDDKDKRTLLENPDDRILAHYYEDSLFTMKTVRFLKDFSLYGAHVHMETSNKTFIRTAELFRKMGIKNYYFLLQLNNEMLRHVDPWDENLDETTQLMVLEECRTNIWYTIREVIKIDGRRFRANRAVISFIWSCLNHLQTLILMPRQSGKEHSGDTKVQQPNGLWKPIREIVVGDTIMAWDGTATKVIGHYPQGDRPSYRFTFSDGRTAPSGPDHLWTVWDAGKGRRGKWRTLTTLEVIARMNELKEAGAKNHLSIPLVDVDKVSSHKHFKVHPYLAGVLINTGTMTQDLVSYHSSDLQLRERVTQMLPAGYESRAVEGSREVQIVRTKDWNPDRHIHLEQELLNLGLLFMDVNQRRIPDVYFTGSHPERLQLLQGLMDTKGTSEKGGNTHFSAASEELGNDVTKLARSLGNIASISGHDKLAIRVNIRAREPWNLFQDEKRKNRVKDCKRGLKFNSKLAIYDYTLEEGKHDSYCIEVDHPDQLYVVDDYVVTHNTVGMQVMAFIMQYLVGRGFRAGLITLAASNRMQFVNAIKKIRSGLPPYLVNMTYKDNDAGNILTYQAYGEAEKNTFEVRVPSGGEDGAENVSRGSTFETLYIDEPAWMKYIENILNGAGPSTLTAQKNAREKGIPYFTAKATTPNSILKDEGRYMYQEMLDSTEWRETYFDSFSETHLVERCIKASPKATTAPQICMQFNHLQLGFGKDWVKETMDKLRLSWSKAKIDLLMMWTEEGKDKLFDDKTRERLVDHKAEAIYNQEVADTGLFIDWFYTKETLEEMFADETEFFLMGVDTSTANNRDACTLVIRRMKTGEVVGVGRYPLAFLDDVTSVLLWCIVNINNSMLVIERNVAAHMIEQLILLLPAYDIDPFERIFNDIIQDPVKYKNEYRDLQETHFRFRTKEFYLRYKRFFGFNTNGTSRKELFMFIQEAVMQTGAGIRYGILVDELVGLETDASGRIDHDSKGHDDLVIAWLLTYWFIKRGYNKSLYKIPQGQTLIEIKSLLENPDQPHFSKDQLELFMRIKARIEELGKELETTDSDLVAKRIEMELKRLGDFIPREMKKTVTVDEIIATSLSVRKKRHAGNRFGTGQRAMGFR